MDAQPQSPQASLPITGHVQNWRGLTPSLGDTSLPEVHMACLKNLPLTTPWAWGCSHRWQDRVGRVVLRWTSGEALQARKKTQGS